LKLRQLERLLKTAGVDVTYQTFGHVLEGRQRRLRREHLIGLCKVTGYPVEYFRGEDLWNSQLVDPRLKHLSEGDRARIWLFLYRCERRLKTDFPKWATDEFGEYALR